MNQNHYKFKEYSGIQSLPGGHASDVIVPGCICLEGGAFRGVYTSGVLDAFMENDLNFQCTIGVSAGALNGINYVSGQIGRSARINLKYRHDPEYVGLKAYHANKGIIGFDFVLKRVNRFDPFDYNTFNRPERRFVAVAVNCGTGKAEYFEKGHCRQIFQAIRASASMPFVSKPVRIGKGEYLDGGCAVKTPYQWAIDQGFKNIVVIKTRPADYVAKRSEMSKLAPVFYRDRPKLAKVIYKNEISYNIESREIERLSQIGRLILIEPSQDISVSRLERNMETLGRFYYLGYEDGLKAIAKVKEYINR